MSNQERKTSLEESADFHEESARFERTQCVSSFALAGSGVALIGTGAGVALKGDLAAGITFITLGTPLAAVYAKEGLEELQDYGEEKRLAGARQAAAKNLD